MKLQDKFVYIFFASIKKTAHHFILENEISFIIIINDEKKIENRNKKSM